MQNRIALNRTTQNQTKACIAKLWCGICTLLRYYTVQNSNSLPMFQDNLSGPIFKVQEIQKPEQSMTEANWHSFLFWDSVHHLII
jgi:hypothetical protein